MKPIIRIEQRRSDMRISDPTETEIRELLERSRAVAVVGLSSDPRRPSHGVARAL
jgi:predicted CoA-binding protein